MSGSQRIALQPPVVRRRGALGSTGIAGLALAGEAIVITASALGVGAVYHGLKFGTAGPIASFAAVGAMTALLFMIPFLSRSEYRLASFLDGRRGVARIVEAWTYAFLALAGIGFLTKTTAVYSRGAVALFAVVGLIAVLAYEAAATLMIRRLLKSGRVAPRRIMLVGTDAEIQRYSERRGLADSAARVVAITVVPSDVDGPAWTGRLAASLERGAEQARIIGVDDVLLLGAADGDRLSRCLGVFQRLPVGIHHDVGPALDHASELRVSRIGAVAAVSLTEPPLTPIGAATKRAFDVVVASVALIVLAPLFAGIAVLIKLDSPGPVIFRQRRQGFNQRVFRIFKFRTMTTLDDGDVIAQAKAGDLRITAIGAKLRRWNIDELPQLLNVLRGDMSIVGPRPHAIAHDRLFEKQIEAYPRRLNVKPGITGWAQVHGFRGETDTEEKLRGRLEHDLHYIDNWSIWLDIFIIVLTIISPKAYRNAL